MSRTCKLQSKSPQTRNVTLLFSFGNVIDAECVPRCHVAQISQMIASTRPFGFGFRACKAKGSTTKPSSGIINTPSDPLLFITARKSLFSQFRISSGTKRSSRFRRSRTTEVASISVNCVRVMECICPAYHLQPTINYILLNVNKVI